MRKERCNRKKKEEEEEREQEAEAERQRRNIGDDDLIRKDKSEVCVGVREIERVCM